MDCLQQLSTSTPRPDWDGESEAYMRYEDLRETNECWGYAVYRTTYLDDDQWERAKGIIIKQATMLLPSPDMINHMDWIFVDDRSALDGASRASLRQRFRAWASKTARERGSDLRQRLEESDSRYYFFLEVDEPSLRSMIGQAGGGGSGHINLVDSQWEPNMREYDSDEERSQNLESEAERESIDGSGEEVVGWMKVSVINLSVDFQIIVDRFLEGHLYQKLYTRPPAVLEIM
ncbi:hypothetical protein ACHAQA_002777 [Verticillium albo-atrum]